MELGLEVDDSRPPYTLVILKGELDIYTSPQLRDTLVELAHDGRRHVVVNLESLDFLDSTGLGVLVGAHKRLRSIDGELTLVCTQRRLLKIFEITGLTSVFKIFRSTEEATSQ